MKERLPAFPFPRWADRALQQLPLRLEAPLTSISPARRSRRDRRRTRPPVGHLVRGLDIAQGLLLLLMAVIAPWLFACSEPWSMTLVNTGLLLAGACGSFHFFVNRPSPVHDHDASPLPAFFFAANLLVLLYIVAALLNARATFSPATQTFAYRQGVLSWLPTTYDRDRTRQLLLNALGFFSFFWSLRYWLDREPVDSSRDSPLPRRLKLALWIFSINGFLLSLQGLFQRFSGSAKLLWIRPSFWNLPDACFGPFSYRGNAADFLNLVWPVSLGFWYALARQRGSRTLGNKDGPELLLVPLSLVACVASFATLSRGGAVVAASMLLIFLALVLRGKASRTLKISAGLTLAAAVLLVVSVSGQALVTRFRAGFSDNLSGRTEIYQNARAIADDFRWFGAGPGSFSAIYGLYRPNPGQEWAAFAHDDWLETRITFGRIGFGLVLINLALLAFWTLSSRRQWISNFLSVSMILALLGCLLHAKRDLPFQTYGVFLNFVFVCSLLINSTRPAIKNGAISPISRSGTIPVSSSI